MYVCVARGLVGSALHGIIHMGFAVEADHKGMTRITKEYFFWTGSSLFNILRNIIYCGCGS